MAKSNPTKTMTRQELAKYIRKQIKKYGINLKDVERGTNLNYYTTQKMMSDESHIPSEKTLRTLEDFIIREYQTTKNDRIICIGDKRVLEEDFMQAVFDNVERLKKYPQWNYFESSLKRQGVIDYLERKAEDDAKKNLRRA